MRKGYGPTGVSFTYLFPDFKADVAEAFKQGLPLFVEMIISGNTYTTEFSADMTESEQRALFDKLDNVSLEGGSRRFQLFAS